MQSEYVFLTQLGLPDAKDQIAFHLSSPPGQNYLGPAVSRSLVTVARTCLLKRIRSRQLAVSQRAQQLAIEVKHNTSVTTEQQTRQLATYQGTRCVLFGF